jgi:hypothetical protein
MMMVDVVMVMKIELVFENLFQHDSEMMMKKKKWMLRVVVKIEVAFEDWFQYDTEMRMKK